MIINKHIYIYKKWENTQDLVSLFTEFTHSREESKKEKLKKIEEMHNEKMAFMGRF